VQLLRVEGVALQLSHVVHVGIFYLLQQAAEVLVAKNYFVECLRNCCELLSLIFSLLQPCS
jgi:hypothetical protein